MQRLNKQRQRILDELMRRSYLYDAALQGFEAESRILPLEKRIDPGLLDSLLGAGLEAKGIRTAFEFGVFDPTRDSLVIEKTGDYSQELLTRGFAINLFPSGSKSNPAYLAVYFPNETRFVLSQIWWMLLVSGLFILVIVVLFYQTVSTIIHQKKLSDMKNDFINNMTHEFKTPISTISLVCEALRDHEVVQSPEMAMNYIGIISEENKRLGLMAEKILQASVLEKGQLHMKSESVDMHEVIRSVVQNAGLQAESRNGHLTFTQGASHSLVTGDRLHLTNVILNLVDNAIKYSPHSPEVRLNTSVTGHFLKIDCADNGIGISKRDQVRIFEKLYRVPTGNLHDVKGFGLGLSYVKAVVEAHHGQISVQSEPRRGSVFTILLPLPPETSLD